MQVSIRFPVPPEPMAIRNGVKLEEAAHRMQTGDDDSSAAAV